MKAAAEIDHFLTQLRREKWAARQQKRRRRSVLLSTLRQCPDVREVMAAITDEAGVGLHAGTVKATKTALRRALRLVPIADQEAPINHVRLAFGRPTWVLRESHRPAIFPGLVDPERPPRSLAPVATILDELEAILRSGRHPYGLLDWLHSVSGLQWARCAEILHAHDCGVDNGAVEMIESARHFWDRLVGFRRIYHNAVRLGQVELAEGDWALAEDSDSSDWLPVLHVPRMHRRETYLVRVVSCGRPLLALDFHGFPSYLPLFTVPM
jgi:hypothetical protein